VAGSDLAKDAAEVSAADFADIVGREALDPHLTDNYREESSSHSGPNPVGALAITRREQIGVGADPDMIDTNRVHHRLDIYATAQAE
jgi:hypothetical protein